MGCWEYKYELGKTGEVEVDGKILPIHSFIRKKDRWIPNMIPHPILGDKGVMIWDPSDLEPPKE